MDQDKIMLSYLDALKEASSRVRGVLLVGLVASVVMFSGAWNVRESNWIRARSNQMWKRVATLMQEQRPLHDPDLQRALAGASQLQRAMVDNLTVRVPFFGVAFDANDIGMIGGPALVVIMIMLRYGMRRQMLTLRLVFDRTTGVPSEGPPLREVYLLASLSQVLTDVPTHLHRHRHPTRHLTKALLFPPVLTMGIVMGMDVVPVFQSLAMAPHAVPFILATEALSLGLLVALTVSGLRFAIDIDREWTKQAIELRFITAQPPPGRFLALLSRDWNLRPR